MIKRSTRAVITAAFVGFLGILLFPGSTHAGFLADLLGFFGYSPQKAVVEERARPIFINETQASVGSAVMPALDSTFNSGDSARGSKEEVGLTMVQNSALVAPLNPLGIVAQEYGVGQIFTYTVKPGDNASAIAKSFGISVNTLLWANNLTNPRSIRPGDQLVILPISGVQVEVKAGDTVDSIAKEFKGNIEDILSYNSLSPDQPLAVGLTLFVPDGEFDWRPVETTESSLYLSQISRYPSYDGYYIRPISGGRKTRGIHGYNGVDLAAPRGTPIYASASGTVIIARYDGWNGGYGKYVVITHPNGTQTLYAHMDTVSVFPGQTVSQGGVIGTVGSTGNSTGPHVHFEIRGARNSF